MYKNITPSKVLVTKLKLDANLVLRNIENTRKKYILDVDK